MNVPPTPTLKYSVNRCLSDRRLCLTFHLGKFSSLRRYCRIEDGIRGSSMIEHVKNFKIGDTLDQRWLWDGIFLGSQIPYPKSRDF